MCRVRTWERRNPGTKPKEFTVLAPRGARQFHLIGRIRIRIVIRRTDVQLGFRAKSLVLTTLFVHCRVLDISIVVARSRTRRTASHPGITPNFLNEPPVAHCARKPLKSSDPYRIPNVQGSKQLFESDKSVKYRSSML